MCEEHVHSKLNKDSISNIETHFSQLPAHVCISTVSQELVAGHVSVYTKANLKYLLAKTTPEIHPAQIQRKLKQNY